MAARWGAGEETLTACNMEFFPLDTLDETAELSSGEALEALQSCLDPSILSIFEDTPTIETKGLDEESEATLLTALTEILDNVDDENLSPFDTLPDSDVLSGQKGREHSPLRRLLCLSRSPQEKDTLCSTRPFSTGKSLPRMLADSLQRSDGEEEEDSSFTLSPVGQDSCPDSDLLDWENLTLPLPVTFEQEGEDGVSVSLGDLVRQIHPYCMTISVENEEGEQMLPEGGILLEVVDQGENGEPILAIPAMDLPVSLPPKELSSEQKTSDEAEEAASDSSEHIVVDDDEEDVVVSDAPVKVSTPGLCSDVKDEVIIKRQKEEIREKSPSRRKKKKKCKEQSQPMPEERRVLRSGTARNPAQESSKKMEKKSLKQEKKHKEKKVPVAATPPLTITKPKEMGPSHTRTQTTATTLSPEITVNVAPSLPPRQDTVKLSASPVKGQPSCSATALSPQQPQEMPKHLVVTPIQQEDSSAAPSAFLPPESPESPAAAPSAATPQVTQPVSEALPPVALPVPEPKPKPLSLAEYRRLRQQKKPAPVEKLDDNSTKWPSLPELPKELPPIPCLPDPSPRDPRRPIPQVAKKEVEEVRPAWQPKGPAAPPTPEALLVPPSYMVAASNKVSAATPVPKPQQTPEPSKQLQKPSAAPAPSSVKNLAPHQPTPVQPAVACVPQSYGSPPSLKPAAQFMTSPVGKCAGALSGGKDEVKGVPQAQPVSPKCVESLKTKTTTDVIKVATAAATGPVLSVPQKTTVVYQKVPDARSAKPLSSGTQTKPAMLEIKEKPQRAKSPTQELIEAFTSEIGIEAADLTSLLEQFEETQAKEEQCVPEVSGRAAAVGNSSVELVPEKTAVERVRASDLSSTAALTPPATPPHQMWKPLAPVALLGKSKASEASKSSPCKVIQIEARPLPSIRSRSKPTPAAAAVDPELACMDHDYCLPNKATGEQGKRWNVKQQSFITIKPIKQQAATTTTQTRPFTPAASLQPAANPVVSTKTQDYPPAQPLEQRRNDGMSGTSVLETPDASPAWQENEHTDVDGSPRRGPRRRSYRQRSSSRTPSPRCSPEETREGRSRKRRSHRSPSPMSSCSESDSHSSRSRSRSGSCSPLKKRYRHNSQSSSSSSSRSSSRSSPSVSRSPPRRRRYSYSSSRSGSWSRSRSRSHSPQRQAQWSRNRRLYSPSYRHSNGYVSKTNTEEVKRRKEKAIEERRVVYVGRIQGTMTQKELKERFSLFGDIEECTLHFREQGDNYGFVTYYDTKDAFNAIENGSKLRKPDEMPFDLCFGGRRQFCKTSYADLDSNREYDPLPSKGKYHALDFDTLLKQAQQNLKR
ncbi:peroxisome proliferator-activated receptor gamma coactivator-related protein 1 [Mugil cephalus]|uniref:peroxisome proliferator-activated receptor gamma coactivator-related protein 1 n=1 Tax=Mugil cephalus TaxID=48193 RepID=UPI001FB6AE4A|nr:peroxisome proliferator-activated receptor gamma coactivator-related protein 1 [Mugil cephalus]